MVNYLYDIKLNPVGYGGGGIITNRKLGICRLNGGLVSVSISTLTGVTETYTLSQSSNVTFDPKVLGAVGQESFFDPTPPGGAGLEGTFRGKFSELIFFRLGTYRRLYTARNSPFGLFGRTAAGFYTITWRPATERRSACRSTPPSRGKRCPCKTRRPRARGAHLVQVCAETALQSCLVRGRAGSRPSAGNGSNERKKR